MRWNCWEYSPKLYATKKVVILDGSINAIWYLLHLPLLAYVVIILAVQKEHTVVIENSPFLLFSVNILDIQPFLNLAPGPDIDQYCASGEGGPYPCNSTDEIYSDCVSWQFSWQFSWHFFILLLVFCHIGPGQAVQQRGPSSSG